jgi:error-prone DNA polymerase
LVLFQEQVLKVARDLAGFTAGQGEQLWRALGAKRADEAIERLRGAFLTGARARGVSESIAIAVFDQLRAFGSYSFPKSHAAAFAVLVYQSAWLKYYYPAAFYCALLNNQPMGFWPPAILVRDAQRHDIEVLSVDILRSQAHCRTDGRRIRLGLNYITGLGEDGAQRIICARQTRLFADLADFCHRTRLPRRLIEALIMAGACDGWSRPRRQLLWELGTLRYQEDELDLPVPGPDVELPPLTRAEAHTAVVAVLGLSTGDHIMAFYRRWLDQQGAQTSLTLETCDDGQRVKVAGHCVVHQAPPTAKGFHFLTLDDEWGMINVIVSPGVVVRDGRHLHSGRVLLVEGTVQREGEVINLIAQRVGPAAVE